ncbi:MAG: LPS export ABC transporter periplasmic protein LptC [Arenimonas sp.]|nr:LPS export ABC transporter periplasmic protein LptC [Arenimonas sp.]
MNYRKATLGLSALVGVLSLIVWNIRPQQNIKSTESNQSDYRLLDFQMTAFNEQGNESFSVAAPLLERDPTGKTLTVKQPVFTFPGKNQEIWHARSDSAWVSEKAREVQLRNNVTITSPVSDLGLQTKFSTNQMTIFPKENRIHSNEWVTISHGTSILKGLGLEADIKQRRVQLLSKVQAHYAPKTP